MNIILMGPPAAGKGTYASLIKKEYELAHISTGDLFRELALKNDPLAEEIKSYMNNGLLVPDKLTIELVANRLLEDDCHKGFILDGFPRNVNQAIELDKMLEKINKKVDAVIDLDVSYELIVKRIVGRRSCSNCNKVYNVNFMPSSKGDICEECGSALYQRKDDTEEKVKVRYDTYLAQTRPVASYYKEKNILININGEDSSMNVFQKIREVLKGV